MSHTMASKCTVCGAVEDHMCPECRTSSAATHGTAKQAPWRHVMSSGFVYQWHPDCLPKVQR